MREERFWDHVGWVSFVYTLLVICAHSYNAELFLGGAGPYHFVGRAERVIGSGIAQIAVPGFFMLSALLFFRDFELSDTLKKWKRRVRSLLVPYLLWNSLYYLGYVIASRIPGLSRVVGKGVVPLNLRQLLRAVFLYDYNYGFWYIFQLLLLVLLSPLVYLCARSLRGYLLSAALLSVVIAFRLNPTALNSDALLYYLTAARMVIVCRERGRRNILLPPLGRERMTVFLFVSALLWQFVALKTGNDLPLVFCRMSGAASLWWLCSCISLPHPPELVRETFLIYALHFAPVRLITKLADSIWHGSAAVSLILYLLMPGFIVLLAFVVQLIGKKYVPFLYRCFTGGR